MQSNSRLLQGSKSVGIVRNRNVKQLKILRRNVVFTAKNKARNMVAVRVTATAQIQAPTEKVEFMTELRQYAMKLHTKEQAPKEGQNEKKSTPVKQWKPTLQGYFNFLVQSKIVYDAFERIFKLTSDPTLAQFQNNGMERGQSLENDIAWYKNQFGVVENDEIQVGSEYAKLLEDLAKNNPPAFICHFYNHFFAHTAGGLMIGKKIAKEILDGKTLEFYTYEENLKEKQQSIRDKINVLAESWSEEEKNECLTSTKDTFERAGKLLGLIIAD